MIPSRSLFANGDAHPRRCWGDFSGQKKVANIHMSFKTKTGWNVGKFLGPSKIVSWTVVRNQWRLYMLCVWKLRIPIKIAISMERDCEKPWKLVILLLMKIGDKPWIFEFRRPGVSDEPSEPYRKARVKTGSFEKYQNREYQILKSLLGGSSHLASGLIHPSYKWTLPPLIPCITRVITHLRFVGWTTK